MGWAFFVSEMDKEQQRKPDFILHGQILFTKSVESGQAVDDGTAERRLIYGEITNSNPDEDNERLISKALDWSYFDDKGWIKYEHVLNDPAHIIGAPHERITTPEGGTIIKGALFNNKKFSDATWELVQSIEEHNRLYPDHEKTLGWSIEGQYTDGKTQKGGYRKAKVINVVITPNPVNKSVYLKALHENHAMFAKSLAANYGEEVEKAMSAGSGTGSDMTHLDELGGGRAITDENIDDGIKQTAEEISGTEDVNGDPKNGKTKKKKKKPAISKSRSETMFENMEEATRHFTDLGKDEDEAKELAKSFFTEAGDGDGDGADESETVQELRGLSKAIEGLKSLFKSSSAADDGGDGGGEADDFTTIPDGEDDYFDAGPMLLSLEKSVNDVQQLLTESVQYGQERDALMAKAFENVAALETELKTAVAAVQASVVVGEGDKAIPLAKAVEILFKSRAINGGPVDLANLQVAGEGEGDGTPAGDRITWKELQGTLAKGKAAGTISEKQASQAETALRTREFDIVKSITDLVSD